MRFGGESAVVIWGNRLVRSGANEVMCLGMGDIF
jgi:hypothetical protein